MLSEAHLERVAARKSQLSKDLESILADVGEFSLEIGCGHGHWLTEFAALDADRFFLGIDLIGDRIERARRKASRARLENIAFLKAEASELVELMPGWCSPASVFVLFPDPWPKKRHWKNRLMNHGFINRLANRCPLGAKLYFRTDHRGYFRWTENVVESSRGWSRDESAIWPFETETVFQAKADSYQSMILNRV